MSTRLIERLREGPGPLVIVGRPHSGSRILARLLRESGVFMGSDSTEPFLDSMGWYQRFVVPLLTSRFFPEWSEHLSSRSFLRFCEERLADTLPGFLGPVEPSGSWGWKFCETLFVMPVVQRLFPAARFVHILRDGRDVCLSDGGYFQLTGQHQDPPRWEARPSFREFCLAVTFGDPGIRWWRGLDLGDRGQLVENRYLLQMQSWVHCVGWARRFGRELGDAYRLVRYEDLCTQPLAEARSLCEWLGIGLPPAAEALLSRTVSRSRIRKWEGARLSPRETRDFANAVRLGTPLLQELGYA